MMGDFYMNITSQEEIYNHSSITSDDSVFITSALTCVIVFTGIPLTLMAIYALYSLVQNDHVAPIYVINLLISDIIQFCCMMVQVLPPEDKKISVIFFYMYLSGLMASVGFMVCVALERYLAITCPLWYRFRRNIKVSVLVCVLVWTFSHAFFLTFLFRVDPTAPEIIASVFLLLPLPLFIFLLCGTLRVLSASRVPSDEKRRIVGTLVLVLLIYTLLFLPTAAEILLKAVGYRNTFSDLSRTLLKLSPLVDLALYVFMRKRTSDKLLASACCCKMDSSDTQQ